MYPILVGYQMHILTKSDTISVIETFVLKAILGMEY